MIKKSTKFEFFVLHKDHHEKRPQILTIFLKHLQNVHERDCFDDIALH